jgi:dimethylhistidine N-methyltransferase
MVCEEKGPLLTVLDSGESDAETARARFAGDVRRGLGGTPKTLPCKYIYDERGSRLFQEIMGLNEYYLTRTELSILREHGREIARALGDEPVRLVELGAGDGTKTSVLLDALDRRGADVRYVPLDCSESAIRGLLGDCERDRPGLDTEGLVADYGDGLRWLAAREGLRNVVLFLGSSIGNFQPREAASFLSEIRGALEEDDLFFIGFDLKKDPDLLVRAYNDARGVTAEFNLNLLRRMNRELGAHFDRELFRFHASWNPAEGAVESFLISTVKQEVPVDALGERFSFEPWEAVHTESSYKFTPDSIAALARRTGFEPLAAYGDARGWFVDALWRAVE